MPDTFALAITIFGSNIFVYKYNFLSLGNCCWMYIMSKNKSEKGKKWRAGQKNQDHRERNWTDLEVELFCSILSDAEYNYALTLESKALKKQANKEVYEGLQMHGLKFNLTSL